MRLSVIIISLLIALQSLNGQVLHSMIFSNMKESADRAADRTEEMKNMSEFCSAIARSLGYTHNLLQHSDGEFTSTQFLKDLNSINVNENDIVIFFYNGHGCNWDDDDWPHMCWKDKQYWQTKAYDLLKEKCTNAKLMLCIACCCNMDSRGRNGYDASYSLDFDPNKVRRLFTGFVGKKSIITSSSIRGQYSYSWVSGNKLGSIYGISLREAIAEMLSPNSNTEVSWTNAFDNAKKRTAYYTSTHDKPQCPQYKIQTRTKALAARSQRTLDWLNGESNKTLTKAPSASVNTTTLEKNVQVGGINSLVIKVDFSTWDMSEEGGMVVAFLESPKGKGVKDTNGKFKAQNGNVSVGSNFGTHKQHTIFNDYKLVIPMEELHIVDPTKEHYIQVGIYDHKTKKYIAFGRYTIL